VFGASAVAAGNGGGVDAGQQGDGEGSEGGEDAMSTPVAGPLAVTPLYSAGADTIVWWDGVSWNAVGALAEVPVDVTAGEALPLGASGAVNIRNGSGAAMTITLPPSPGDGQTLRFKDAAGNAGTYSITLQGASGATIDGNPHYMLMSDYVSLEVFWMGAQWGTR
jgi:hypothetical protein